MVHLRKLHFIFRHLVHHETEVFLLLADAGEANHEVKAIYEVPFVVPVCLALLRVNALQAVLTLSKNF